MIEEQALEQCFSAFARWRLTWAHHAVNFNQRLLIAFALIGLQRVADICTSVDVIDIQNVKALEAQFFQSKQRLFGDFFASFSKNFTGLFIHHFIGDIAAIEIFITHQQFLGAIFGDLAGHTWRNLFASLNNNLAGFSIHQINHRLHAFEALRHIRHTPAFFGLREGKALVEIMQNFF